ncbi:hypothetical protein HanIR_Chr13g0656591 [Helianthus annuus]|nr:hypothetical protein HanIR_Chr13g0656591 [Helianthus annuus]
MCIFVLLYVCVLTVYNIKLEVGCETVVYYHCTTAFFNRERVLYNFKSCESRLFNYTNLIHVIRWISKKIMFRLHLVKEFI